MIFELDHWAREFEISASSLQNSFAKRHNSMSAAEETESVFQIERSILCIAFFTRRLFEEAKQAETASSYTPFRPPLEAIRSIAEKPVSLPHSIGPMFEIGASFTMSQKALCDEVIHHRVLNWEKRSDSDEEGLFISSDYSSAKRIVFVPLRVILGICAEVSALSKE